jgi:hypothetical protein
MTIPANRDQLEYLRAQYSNDMCFFSEHYAVAPAANIDFPVPARKVFVPGSGAGNLVVRLLGDTADTTIQVETEQTFEGLAIVRIVGTSTTCRYFTVFW